MCRKTISDLEKKIDSSNRAVLLTTIKKFMNLNDKEFNRLKESEIMHLTDSRLSVTKIVISFNGLSKITGKCIRVTSRKSERDFGCFDNNNKDNNIELNRFGFDRYFILSLIEAYIFDGKNGVDKAFKDYCVYKANKAIEERAKALDYDDVLVYIKDKSEGVVDWESNRVYNLLTSNESMGTHYNWRYNGQNYMIKNASLYWSSFNELYNRFKQSNPPDFGSALEALFKYQSESMDSARTSYSNTGESRSTYDPVQSYIDDKKESDWLYRVLK